MQAASMVLENEKKRYLQTLEQCGPLDNFDLPTQQATISLDGFHGARLHFWRAKVGCVFGAVVCKIQARRSYIKSLPPVPKDKRSYFSQGERCAVQMVTNL